MIYVVKRVENSAAHSDKILHIFDTRYAAQQKADQLNETWDDHHYVLALRLKFGEYVCA